MVTFSPEDIATIARLSGLEVSKDEQEAFAQQLAEILAYTSQLSEVSAQATPELSTPNVNEFRDDKAVSTDNEAILANAPQIEDTYFVVPRILQH